MQLVTMEDDKSKEELDDLRKKRLNYFRSIDTLQTKTKSVQDMNDNTKQPHGSTSTYNNVVSIDLQKTASDIRKVPDKSIIENGIKTIIEFNSCYENASVRNSHKTTIKHGESKKQETDADGLICNDQVSLKVSSFDLSSPDGIQKQNKDCVEMKDIHENLKDSNISDGLDAYNETVERLIRATKEELLGLKVSDNIWTQFTKESESVPETTGELASQTSVVPNLHLYEYDSKQTLKTENDTPSERQSFQNNHLEIVNGNTYVNMPFYSNLEPSQNNGRTESFDSSKIEQIFSCRQTPWSHLSCTGKDSDEVNVKTKIDLPVHLSQELLDIKLSTHRPDSGRDENIEAEDLQLEDSVTKELKLVLGEEKFKQFLMKSKKDIDNLHESSSNGSSERQEKTPRLRKQKPAIPLSSVQKSDESKEHKTTTQTNVKNNIKENYQEPQLHHSILKKRSVSKSDASMHLNASQEFTPRIAVEDMIAEYILHDVKDDTKMTLNRDRSKLNENEQNRKCGKGESNRSIPDLVAEESNKFDSFRPKLNRPKYEPHSIYQDQDGKEKNWMYSTSAESVMSKNYEQITVPRNFAFSANEIYNQAYGKSFLVHALSTDQQHVGDNMQFAQYLDYTNQATLLSAPVPLQSPVAPSHIPYHQVYAQGGMFKDQHSYIYPVDDINTFRKYPEVVAKRQSSLTNEFQLLPHPPNQSPPQTHACSHFQQDGANNADPQGYSAHSESRCNGQILGTEQTFHIPHPPADVNQSCTLSKAVYTSALGIPIGYTYPYQVMMFAAPQQLTNVTTAPQKISVQVLGTTQTTLNPVPDKIVVNIPLPTSTTAHAEVQTDRDDSSAVQGNEKLVVTPENQMSKEEKLIPHPPAVKDEGKSPRRHHTANVLTTQQVQDPQRHIDGIRQHHQQRKQEEVSRQLTDNQILARQRKYAKASLDRYFSSLENVYKSSLTSTSMEMSSNEHEKEAGHDAPNVSESHNAIDDGLNNIFVEKDINEAHARNFGENKYIEDKVSLDFTENNAQDVKTNAEKVSNERKSAPVLETCSEFDNDTTVHSVSNADMSVKAGGITDRLKEIGINVVHTGQAKKEQMVSNKKKEGKKGKVLIICPECNSLNKEYMSWCSQCGEMIIGIEPMLVSKNKNGQIRTRPLKTGDTSQCIVDKQSNATKSNESFKIEPPNKIAEINNVEELNEKTFLLNFDGIKIAEANDEFAFKENRSEVKDSGKPSREECGLELHSQDMDIGMYFQTKKIEEEVVNDICDTISDPVVKGYLKSHFNKSKCLSVVEDESAVKDSHLGKIHDIVYRNQPVDVKINHSDLSKEYPAYSTNNESFINVNENKHLDNSHINIDDQGNFKTTAPSENVQAKIHMFDKLNKPECSQSKKIIFKDTSGASETYSKSMFIPSPLCSLNTAEPKPPNELALKLPAGSMDYSTDLSYVMSYNFDVAHVDDGKSASEKEIADKTKEEKKRQRQRKRGHGAIDVEVFGYDESRESRNSSRAVGMVPLLNLTGNSSDEDDSSVKSDTKLEVKHNLVSQLPYRAAVTSAWEPDIIQEEPSENRHLLPFQHSVLEDVNRFKSSSQLQMSSPEVSSETMVDSPCERTMQHWVKGSDTLGEHTMQNTMKQMEVPNSVAECPRHKTMQQHVGDSYEWKQMFDPQADVQDEVDEEITVDGQPLLEQIIQQHKKRQMSKKRPNSGKSKAVKHKVCQSIQPPAYQRKWPKSSSLVRSSFTAGHMNTASTSSFDSPVTSSPPRLDVDEVKTSGVQDARRSFPVRPMSGLKETQINVKSKHSKRNCKEGIDLNLDTELVTDMVEHRLPKPNMLDRLKGNQGTSHHHGIPPFVDVLPYSI